MVGEGFIIVTYEAGGKSTVRRGTYPEFQYIRKCGAIYEPGMDSDDPFSRVKYVAFSRMIEDFDLVLGRRGDT